MILQNLPNVLPDFFQIDLKFPLDKVPIIRNSSSNKLEIEDDHYSDTHKKAFMKTMEITFKFESNEELENEKQEDKIWNSSSVFNLNDDSSSCYSFVTTTDCSSASCKDANSEFSGTDSRCSVQSRTSTTDKYTHDTVESRRHSVGSAVLNFLTPQRSTLLTTSLASLSPEHNISRQSILTTRRIFREPRLPSPESQAKTQNTSAFKSLATIPSAIKNASIWNSYSSRSSVTKTPNLPKIPPGKPSNVSKVFGLSDNKTMYSSSKSINSTRFSTYFQKPQQQNQHITHDLLEQTQSGMLCIKKDLSKKDNPRKRKWEPFWAILTRNEMILFGNYDWFISKFVKNGVLLKTKTLSFEVINYAIKIGFDLLQYI
ncbi:hypothetical protein HK096_009857 [Nowakowskiella sp. JEL0078]|nr:hypothetical protein HK096_009857 [Nowakowskiella sp. JEL0078]